MLCFYERLWTVLVVEVHRREVTAVNVPHLDTAASLWTRRKHSPALFPISLLAHRWSQAPLTAQGNLSLSVLQHQTKQNKTNQFLEGKQDAPWHRAFPLWQWGRGGSTIPGFFQLVWRLHPAASPCAPPNRAAACRAHTAPPNSNPLFLTTSSSVLTGAALLLLFTHATLQETVLPPSCGCLRPGVPCILEGILLLPWNSSPHPKPPSSSPAPQDVFTHTSQEQQGSASCPA